MARQYAGCLGVNPCQTTALHLRIGSTPGNEILVNLVANFIRVWSDSDHRKQGKILSTWSILAAKARETPSNKIWAIAGCPLSSTIAALCQAGWDPKHPEKWLTSDGAERLTLGTPSHDAETVMTFRRRLYDQSWQAAAAHFCGGGA